MLNIALFEPEIPPNTGNIIRLCANTGCGLHIVGQAAFELDDKRLRRAGLDYHEYSDLSSWPDWASYRDANSAGVSWAFSTHGEVCYSEARFQAGDTLLFGPESRGLPKTLLNEFGEHQVLRLPMQANSRSMNLSNAVAVATYEALRQLQFPGLD